MLNLHFVSISCFSKSKTLLLLNNNNKVFSFIRRRTFYNPSNTNIFDMWDGVKHNVSYPKPYGYEGTNENGIDIYLRIFNYNSNAVIFYYGTYQVTNVTPAGLWRTYPHKSRIFYISHYWNCPKRKCTLHLTWPVWIGKEPKDVLTMAVPGWFNPFSKGIWQTYYIGEFAYVNAMHLPVYDFQWDRLDFSKSPFDRYEIEDWWKSKFFARVGIKAKDCFGYAVYRYAGKSTRKAPSGRLPFLSPSPGNFVSRALANPPHTHSTMPIYSKPIQDTWDYGATTLPPIKEDAKRKSVHPHYKIPESWYYIPLAEVIHKDNKNFLKALSSNFRKGDYPINNNINPEPLHGASEQYWQAILELYKEKSLADPLLFAYNPQVYEVCDYCGLEDSKNIREFLDTTYRNVLNESGLFIDKKLDWDLILKLFSPKSNAKKDPADSYFTINDNYDEAIYDYSDCSSEDEIYRHDPLDRSIVSPNSQRIAFRTYKQQRDAMEPSKEARDDSLESSSEDSVLSDTNDNTWHVDSLRRMNVENTKDKDKDTFFLDNISSYPKKIRHRQEPCDAEEESQMSLILDLPWYCYFPIYRSMRRTFNSSFDKSVKCGAKSAKYDARKPYGEDYINYSTAKGTEFISSYDDSSQVNLVSNELSLELKEGVPIISKQIDNQVTRANLFNLFYIHLKMLSPFYEFNEHKLYELHKMSITAEFMLTKRRNIKDLKTAELLLFGSANSVNRAVFEQTVFDSLNHDAYLNFMVSANKMYGDAITDTISDSDFINIDWDAQRENLDNIEEVLYAAYRDKDPIPLTGPVSRETVCNGMLESESPYDSFSFFNENSYSHAWMKDIETTFRRVFVYKRRWDEAYKRKEAREALELHSSILEPVNMDVFDVMIDIKAEHEFAAAVTKAAAAAAAKRASYLRRHFGTFEPEAADTGIVFIKNMDVFNTWLYKIEKDWETAERRRRLAEMRTFHINPQGKVALTKRHEEVEELKSVLKDFDLPSTSTTNSKKNAKDIEEEESNASSENPSFSSDDGPSYSSYDNWNAWTEDSDCSSSSSGIFHVDDGKPKKDKIDLSYWNRYCISSESESEELYDILFWEQLQAEEEHIASRPRTSSQEEEFSDEFSYESSEEEDDYFSDGYPSDGANFALPPWDDPAHEDDYVNDADWDMPHGWADEDLFNNDTAWLMFEIRRDTINNSKKKNPKSEE